MGIQTPSSSDRLRTHWTPAMDRYFIDLMLEQVQRGSRIDDHLFSKRAWKHMTMLFNAKFRFQYDKDVLKNRHKTLRKLYRAIRNLLEQRGFSWNETLQMVTADDDVWDNYIKAHPDARSYRTKTMPYYTDLCMIYKNETSEVGHNSNLNNDSSGTKIDGLLESPKAPATPVADGVQESSSLLVLDEDISDQQNKQQSPMLSTTQPGSTEESLMDVPGMKIGGVFEGPKSLSISISHADPVVNVQLSSSHSDVDVDVSDQENKQQTAILSTSRLRSTDEGMEDYLGMKIGLLEGSKSSAMSVAHEDLVDNVQVLSSHSIMNVDLSFQQKQESVMPSTSELRSSDEYMDVDIPGIKIGEVLEGPKSLAMSITYKDQVDNVQEPSAHSGVDVDTSEQQNKQQPVMLPTSQKRSIGEGTLDAPRTKIGGVLEVPKSPAILVACGDLLNNVQESSSHSDVDVDVDVSDQQSKQQTMMSSTSQPRGTDEGTVDALHEMAIGATSLANKDVNGNSVSIENRIDALQAVPDLSNTTSSNRFRTNWTPPMDRYFVDLMLDQVHKGNMIDGACRKQAWKHMIALFNAKFGFQYDTDVLKNRYKTLRKHYNAVTNLLDQRGFIWDDTRHMVTANDYVWHDYIKAHPDAGQYRTRPMPYYNDLCVIYKDATVDGRYSCSGPDVNLRDDVPVMRIGGPLIDLQSPTTSAAHEDPVDNGTMDLYDQQNKRRPATPLSPQHSKKIRSSSDGSMVDALREMANAVTSLADKKKENNNSISIENVINALQALPDIDDDLLLDACDFLEDEKKAKTFLALDVMLRKKWLMRKLRP